jgi:hypothetical protein
MSSSDGMHIGTFGTKVIIVSQKLVKFTTIIFCKNWTVLNFLPKLTNDIFCKNWTVLNFLPKLTNDQYKIFLINQLTIMIFFLIKLITQVIKLITLDVHNYTNTTKTTKTTFLTTKTTAFYTYPKWLYLNILINYG